jgi:hypothetical protein
MGVLIDALQEMMVTRMRVVSDLSQLQLQGQGQEEEEDLIKVPQQTQCKH